ncbi:hypothetical protein [Nonomuraea fuscirosea]|uniref:hypothetical protein n=1 Tax=Nonomuraea fuscirosea TaxID=1291556 RepID=UPI00342C5174
MSVLGGRAPGGGDAGAEAAGHRVGGLGTIGAREAFGAAGCLVAMRRLRGVPARGGVVRWVLELPVVREFGAWRRSRTAFGARAWMTCCTEVAWGAGVAWGVGMACCVGMAWSAGVGFEARSA